MDNNLLVSVILPVYNAYPYLSETLESVIHQTYKHLEILLIDDGSSDGSGDICDEYANKDERIKVVHQVNSGVATARNTGLNILTGEVIAFLDSDDLYDPEYVQTMVSALLQENADLVMCKYSKFSSNSTSNHNNENCNVFPKIESGIYNRSSALCALIDGTIDHYLWNKVYRKKLWNSIRFPDGHLYEDEDTIFRILDHCEMVYVLDQSLYFYRLHSSSITHSRSLKKTNDRIITWTHITSFVEDNTPGTFTNKQLKESRQFLVIQMVTYYMQLLSEHKEKECGAEVRKKLIENEMIVKDCGLLIRLSYFIIRYCPWMIKIIYPIYCKIRRF